MEQYQPLFLKYRPQSLSDLVGQQYVALTLANAIKNDRISHAYLFTGPRGTGKTSSARILAKSLNCHKGPTVEPCQVCTACVEIKEGISTAVMEIDAASNNSVDDARTLIERAPLVAAGGRFKLYIVDECHMLTKEAFNALLKTIEEPPPNVIFILATTEEQKVPPTIHSRCQRLMFRLINQTEMYDHLGKIAKQEDISIDAKALDLIARHSGGGLRDALGLLDQASLLSSSDHAVSVDDLLLLVGALAEDVLLSMSNSIIAGDGLGALTLAQKLLSEGKEAHLIVAELARHILNLAKATCLTKVNKTAQEELATIVRGSDQYIESLIGASKGLDSAELAAIVENLDRLEGTCKRSSQPALNLEIGLLSLCHRLDLKSLKAIEQRIDKLEADRGLADSEPIARPARKPQPVTVEVSESEETTKPAKPQDKQDPVEPETGNSVEHVEHIAEPPAREHQPQKESATTQAATATINESANEELDSLWSELLDELQKRHLPTFSLVSTHAFPLALVEDELTVGVLVENFQKMIENKIEHLKAASQTVIGKPLRIRVKTVDQSTPPPSGKSHSGQSKDGKGQTKEQGAPKQARSNSQAEESLAIQQEAPENEAKGNKPAAKIGENSHGQAISHLVKDAYGLFEGPGSRLITANQ